MTTENGTSERVRVVGSRRSRDALGNEVTLGPLTLEELEVIEGMVLGACWLRTTEDGRIESRPRFAELPAPEKDPKLPPQWAGKTDWTGKPVIEYARDPDLPEETKPAPGSNPSLYVQHLGGYNRTPYACEAGKLQSYGFECLRSRRGRDGHFWEIWYLPGLWAAKGDLAKWIESTKDTPAQLRKAIDFLCEHVAFGVLHVGDQRACMVID